MIEYLILTCVLLGFSITLFILMIINIELFEWIKWKLARNHAVCYSRDSEFTTLFLGLLTADAILAGILTLMMKR